jgi:hypothetical protein
MSDDRKSDGAQMAWWVAVALSISWIVGDAVDHPICNQGVVHPVAARMAANLIMWILGGGFLATWNKWRKE